MKHNFHYTETALLRIQYDLLLAIDPRKLSTLVLLDLSAAFDTIDHQLLLTRLSSTFGVTPKAVRVSPCAYSLLILLTVPSVSPLTPTQQLLHQCILASHKVLYLDPFFLAFTSLL